MSNTESARRRKAVKNVLICKPLDSLEEIRVFLEDPPPWRSLCKELTPHSKFVIRNIEHKESCEPVLEAPETFCHFDPDTEVPNRYDVTVKKLPKTLVCHDMANGYHDDSKIEGTQIYDAYTFYNWAAIDIFCYFSHHLITIPPVSWINVGHEHGVKVIGTIITEWAEGTKFWDVILSSETEYQNFASSVVAIAKTMKFDGWLLNIENKVSKPDVLLAFIRYLHKTLHAALVDPVLIWYDSVTAAGNLNWQNELNSKNKAFFDICDGIFTNYSWTVNNVKNCVKAAGDRATDVFIGIDVWGRNFYGGGQFNVQVAVKVAYDAGCSMAIFAPAWTHEAMFDEGACTLRTPEDFTQFEQFNLRDRALWGSIWPFLNLHLPCKLPFQTSFCRGQGRKRWMYGEVISPGPWYNLRHQQYQPNCAHGPHGYVLSSVGKLLPTSLNTDKKVGIIKYRNDLGILRNIDPDLDHSRPHGAPEDDDQINDSDNSSDEVKQGAPEDDDKVHDSDNSSNEGQSLKVKASFVQFQTLPGSMTELKAEVAPEITNAANHVVTDENKASTSNTSDSSKKGGLKKLIAKLKASFKKLGSETEQQIETKSSDLGGPSTRSHKQEVHEKHEGHAYELKAKGRSMVAMSVNLNLNLAEYKTRWALAHVPVERECLALHLDDGFNGGSCLKVNPSDIISTDHRTIRLFHCDFYCPDTLIVCVVTKTIVQSPDQSLNIKLIMKNESGKDLLVVLLGKSEGGDKITAAFDKTTTGTVFSYPLHSVHQEAFRRLREYLLVNESGFYVPLENLYGWKVRYHEVHVPGSRVMEVNCRTVLSQGGILLGHLGICSKNETKQAELTT